MIIYVWNEASGAIEKFVRCLDEAMPYTHGCRMTVRNFLSGVKTDVMWTTKRFLVSIDQMLDRCPTFTVRVGFRRGWQDVENGQYTQKLGTALAGGSNLSYPKRVRLARQAEAEEWFDWIGALDHTPWLLQVSQDASDDCDLVPFATLKKGAKGTTVFVLQDCLWYLGYSICQLNGEFDETLEQEVCRFQCNQGLPTDGICGPDTWIAIMRLVHPEDKRLDASID